MQILLHGLKNTELHDLLYGKIKNVTLCICTGNELEKFRTPGLKCKVY